MSASAIFRLLLVAACLVATPARAQPPIILVLGDSLSAGYGFSVDRGWVALLDKRLAEKGYRYAVHNASVSGDTSRGALSRLPDLLDRIAPRITIVELGGNDGLRGIALDEIETSLRSIVRTLARAGSAVLLIPIEIPPNYGPAYTSGLAAIYAALDAEPGVTLASFLLDGVALDPALMQDDGIHPVAEAQPRILDNVWPHLEPLLVPEPSP
jgi:acyl-CoA thioesterase-1